MKNISFILFLTIVFSSMTLLSLAQNNNKYNRHCGFEPSLEQIALSQVHQAGLQYWEKQFSQTQYRGKKQPLDIPVFFHIAQSEATGEVATTSEIIQASLNRTNSFFKEAGFQFVLLGLDTIQDEAFYKNGNGAEDLFTRFNQPNSINIYVLSEFGSGLFGYAYFGGELVIQSFELTPASDGITLPHELGHIFGLYHTHGLNESENANCARYVDSDLIPDGFPDQVFCEGASRFDDMLLDTNMDSIPDCAQTGDFICDTPAEPILIGLVDTLCNYIGTDIDYYGDAYQPRTDNIMNYSFGCEMLFTPDQNARMFAFLMEFNQNLLCPIPIAPTTSRKLMVENMEPGCQGSFRWAIEMANVRPGMDTILFEEEMFRDTQVIYVSKYLPIHSDLIIKGNGKVIIDGSKMNGLALSGNTGIAISNSENIWMEGLTFRNLPDIALSIYGAENITLDKVIFEDNSNIGLGVYSSRNIHIQNCQLKNNFTGVRLTRTKMVEVTNCQVIANSDIGFSTFDNEVLRIDSLFAIGNRIGILVNECDTLQLRRVYTQNNESTGVLLDRVKYGMLQSIESIENGFNGLSIYHSENIVGEYINTSKNSRAGCRIYNASNIQLDTAIFLRNQSTGLTIDSSATVKITRGTSQENDGNGVFIKSLSSHIDLEQLKVSQNGFHGLSISASSFINVNQSAFVESERHGIGLFKGSTAIDIQNSQLVLNKRSGLSLFDSTSVFCGNNIIKDNVDGITVLENSTLIVDSSMIHSNKESGFFIGRTGNVLVKHSQIYKNLDIGIHSINVDVETANFNIPSAISIENSAIYNNGRTAILEETTKPLTVLNTVLYCNEGASITNQNQMLIPKEIEVINNQIIGLGIPQSQIFIYTNPQDCQNCGAGELFGTTFTDEEGNWQLDSLTFEVDSIYQISAIAVYEGKTSPISNCASYTHSIDNMTTSVDAIELTKLLPITIYPNPFFNNLQLQIGTKNVNPSQVQLINLSGKILDTFWVNNTKWFTKDLSHLPQGIYLLKITNGQLSRTIKVVKQ